MGWRHCGRLPPRRTAARGAAPGTGRPRQSDDRHHPTDLHRRRRLCQRRGRAARRPRRPCVRHERTLLHVLGLEREPPTADQSVPARHHRGCHQGHEDPHLAERRDRHPAVPHGWIAQHRAGRQVLPVHRRQHHVGQFAADEQCVRQGAPDQPGRHHADRQSVLRRRRNQHRHDLGPRSAQRLPRQLRHRHRRVLGGRRGRQQCGHRVRGDRHRQPWREPRLAELRRPARTAQGRCRVPVWDHRAHLQLHP